MQDVGALDVGPVVDREQRTVPPSGVGQHFERGQLVAGLQWSDGGLTGRALVAQLDDVHPPANAPSANLARSPRSRRVSAHREHRRSQPIPELVHIARNVVSTRESRDAGTESGH